METLIYILISFWSYFLVSYLAYRLNTTKVEDAFLSPGQKGFAILNTRHLLGIIIFGFSSYLFFRNSDFILLNNFIDNPELSFAVAFFAVISLDLSASDALSKNIISETQINFKDGLIYLGIRLVFLLAYEAFFRGVLFWFCLQYFGLVNSILINLFFYGLIHIMDSKKEILGSIPFGIVLCLFTYYSSSIWPAFIIHASLSLGYETIIISKSLTKIQKS